MTIHIPNFCLVVLVGPSSSGKSTLARNHFQPYETVSSDHCRALITNKENVLDANREAFDLLHYIIGKRLQRGLLTVADATNVQPEGRRAYIDLARRHYAPVIALVLDMPERLLQYRNEQRADRDMGAHVIRNQLRQLRRSQRELRREGFDAVYELYGQEAIEALELVRQPLANDRTEIHGPFDIIGDVHGCQTELLALLKKLGYQVHLDEASTYGYSVTAPAGRTAVFVGDLVDRGPDSNKVLRLLMSMMTDGTALCVVGNHDDKLMRYLKGKKVQIKHGLEQTIAQLEQEPASILPEIQQFLAGLPDHLLLDRGQLVVAHAGLRADMQGRMGKAVRAFCLYGETTGEIDEFGLPVRYPWAREYEGRATVVYGHTPVPEAEWINHTINIDTGCVFGGRLTALRYPEMELVDVAAERTYATPKRPIEPVAQVLDTDLLDAQAVLGRQAIPTRLRGRITISENHAAGALETMSRFATDPRWLIYLPPTMSPVAVSTHDDFLEHPAEAFDYYRSVGVKRVVCQEKHMGSRALVVIGQSAQAIEDRFELAAPCGGHIMSRSGRPFFDNLSLERELLEHFRSAMTQSGFWQRHQTTWAVFDAELMPWSAKAQSLLREQYAALGAAGALSLKGMQEAARTASERGIDLEGLVEQIDWQQQQIGYFKEAYRSYCWPVVRVEDLRLAPFHLLATEGNVHDTQPHTWHLAEIDAVCQEGRPLLFPTNRCWVELDDSEQIQTATEWWLQLTESGGEGMVVKPEAFVVQGAHDLVQPALKVRGRNYLRLIYGPNYLHPKNLRKLKRRRLRHKRSLALREFALGIEALDRFIRKEPLRKVHQCVFGISALEHEPVDPTL